MPSLLMPKGSREQQLRTCQQVYKNSKFIWITFQVIQKFTLSRSRSSFTCSPNQAPNILVPQPKVRAQSRSNWKYWFLFFITSLGLPTFILNILPSKVFAMRKETRKKKENHLSQKYLPHTKFLCNMGLSLKNYKTQKKPFKSVN